MTAQDDHDAYAPLWRIALGYLWELAQLVGMLATVTLFMGACWGFMGLLSAWQ